MISLQERIFNSESFQKLLQPSEGNYCCSCATVSLLQVSIVHISFNFLYQFYNATLPCDASLRSGEPSGVEGIKFTGGSRIWKNKGRSQVQWVVRFVSWKRSEWPNGFKKASEERRASSESRKLGACKAEPLLRTKGNTQVENQWPSPRNSREIIQEFDVHLNEWLFSLQLKSDERVCHFDYLQSLRVGRTDKDRGNKPGALEQELKSCSTGIFIYGRRTPKKTFKKFYSLLK